MTTKIGPCGRTLLLQEAMEGRHAHVCLALDRGASVMCMDDNGDTALSLALRSGESQASLILTDLLEAGADMSLKDGSGQPLLKVALANATKEVVKQVIEILSPLSSESHQCIQQWAANLPPDGNQWSDRTVSVLRLLLTYGLDSNARQSNQNMSLLDMAMTRQAAGSEALVEELLSQGARPILSSALRLATPHSLDLVLTRLTPLTDGHRQQMVSWFSGLPAELWKWTMRDKRILTLLVDFGLDPDVRQAQEPHAPLVVCAAGTGDMELVRKLIAHKAKLGASDDYSNTALIHAAKNKNRAMYDLLKTGGANDRMFFWTIWTNYAPG